MARIEEKGLLGCSCRDSVLFFCRVLIKQIQEKGANSHALKVPLAGLGRRSHLL